MVAARRTPEEVARNKEFRTLQLEWCKQIARDSKLPAASKSVGVIIALQYLNIDSRLAFPSYATLASEINAKENTAIAAVKALIRAGHLVVAIPGQKGRGKPNHYALVLKSEENPAKEKVLSQENPRASGRISKPENLQNYSAKTPAAGGMNHKEPHPHNPQDTPSPPQPTDTEIDRLVAELLAVMPPRPDATPEPSKKLRAKIVAALSAGATREEILDGARRYRRFVQTVYKENAYRYAKRPEAWMAQRLWTAAWTIPLRNGATSDDAAALLREIQGLPHDEANLQRRDSPEFGQVQPDG